MKSLPSLLFIFFLPAFLDAQIIMSPEVDSIPMRDGKKLAADIYLPDTNGKYPVILIQTPYNRLLYRLNLPFIGKDIKNSPYAFVTVDWRCFYGSRDACVLVPDRGKDGYDVIDWISRQPWSNGKVGTYGPSALGKIQFMTAREQHPAHVCAVPQVAAPQFIYQEYFPGGVYRTEYVQQLDALGFGMSQILLAHPYYDNWWKLSDFVSWYPNKIKIPVFYVGGWFDHNIREMFDYFDTLIQVSSSAQKSQLKMLIGPWSHMTIDRDEVGDLDFSPVKGIADSLAFLFFDYHLRGAKNGWPFKPRFMFYGLDWHSFSQYSVQSYSTDKEKGLSDSLVLLKLDDFLPDSLLFIANPRFPSPTIGGPVLRLDLEQGPVDISSVIHEDSSHIFIAIPIQEGETLSIRGPSFLHAEVSSNCKDMDLAVRLAVGSQSSPEKIIIADGIARARFRNGFEKKDEQFLKPGQHVELNIEFPPQFITLYEGAVLYIIISGSNYPRFDLNLNNGGEMYQPGDTLTAYNYLFGGNKTYFRFAGYYRKISGTAPVYEPKVEIYPNPGSNIIFLSAGKTRIENLKIFDLTGKLMLTRTFPPPSINVTSLKPGFYIIQCTLHGKKYFCKWVKNY